MKIPLYPIETLFKLEKTNCRWVADNTPDSKNPFEILLGSTITGYSLDASKTKLTVKFTRTDLKNYNYNSIDCQAVFEAQGDCCNNVWFESITDGITGFVICTEGKETFNIQESLQKGNQGHEDMLCWTISTSGGYLDIDVRNSNNGYYSGSVNLVGLVLGI